MKINNIQNYRICSLEEVLNYQNNSVVLKFQREFKLTHNESYEIFEELKKWLWIGAFFRVQSAKENLEMPKLRITSSLRIIDEMWHCFILFTKEYNNFCIEYFGFFIHHSPSVKILNPKDKIENKRVLDVDVKYQIEKKLLCFALGDELGIQTFNTWYKKYREKYKNTIK